ncbi:PREDICTED: cysteine dioxygenase type 1 [Nicrophorus vespilloides]|uniref:Cysteine dioxygenase n=1 Tax=Nicrophorus vespilloides TaxID=110193 RepID=A0ABM1N8F3_NICVS|nr:PREDICTED: cysteine dioxygenase type 1 [Nicrophorus vespilloides]
MEVCNRENVITDVDLIKRFGDNLPVANNLDELIEELNKIFASDEVNIELVDYILRTYKSNVDDWKKFAKFDRYRYTRNLVNSGNGKYNLILLCWGEGQGSSIHDHANAHCFMKMLQGELQEIRYEWPKQQGEELQEMGRTILKENSVCYINDEQGLHRVENVSHTDPAISLHLYSPPFDTCHMFDKKTGRKTASKVTFWSMYGKKESQE